jgi:hypothetical protein
MSNPQGPPQEQPEPRKRSRKKNGKGTKGGHPPFEATQAERAFVAAMASMKLSVKEICQVLGAGRNGVGGKPIGRHTLYRNFKREMANGGALLRAKISGKFHQAIDNSERWALEMALRNRFAWDAARGGVGGAIAPDGDAPVLRPQVTFHIPGYGEGRDPDPPLQPNQPIPNQRLLPSPPKLVRTPFGDIIPDDWPDPPKPRTELDEPQRHQGGGESRLWPPAGKGTDWMG